MDYFKLASHVLIAWCESALETSINDRQQRNPGPYSQRRRD
jgi:hypothetical protein